MPQSVIGGEARQIAQEHGDIIRMLKSLDKTHETAELRTLLSKLDTYLRDHFANEERPGGLYQELTDQQPGLMTRLQTLTRQHVEIADLLENVVAAVDGIDAAHAALDEAKAGFIAMVRQHEATESSLIVEAWSTDLGGSG